MENKNILSTLGSNNLEEIKPMGEKNNLYGHYIEPYVGGAGVAFEG